MTQQTADACADKGNLLATVNGAVIDEQLFGNAAFIEGGADGLDEGIDVLLEEELAMAQDAAGVVDERNKPRLFALV
jgi:hypothetical protein